MHLTFAEGTSLRYRSSTNNEDLPGFNGAGLYDSKTQKPDEQPISKSLKQVYASLWTFRAFSEREFHRIDHRKTAMGVLVHPNYSKELANGVAVSFDILYGGPGKYYVNTQIGEDLVTNPEAHSTPEEIFLYKVGGYNVIATSNQVEPGELLMNDAQIRQLAGHLTTIHEKFEDLYAPGPDEPFAMEIEFKITSEDVLAIKQARPWVFGVTGDGGGSDPGDGGSDPGGGGPGGGGPGGGGPNPDDADDGEGDAGDDGDDGEHDDGGPPSAAFETVAECVGDVCGARTGVSMTFSDTTSGTVRFRTWDFGDGSKSRSRSATHAWSEPGFYEVLLWVSDGAVESTASRIFLVEANEPAGTCEAGEHTLCLQDSRYAVEVEWWTREGEGGAAKVVLAGTNDSGLFWFFDRNNWEVLVKVLNACAIDGRVWVFGASTTDLGYRVVVTDTVTGSAREYRNAPGEPADAITDWTAFREGCDGAAGSAGRR